MKDQKEKETNNLSDDDLESVAGGFLGSMKRNVRRAESEVWSKIMSAIEEAERKADEED